MWQSENYEHVRKSLILVCECDGGSSQLHNGGEEGGPIAASQTENQECSFGFGNVGDVGKSVVVQPENKEKKHHF